MKSSNNNPSTNVLRSGINEHDILDAIEKSGYPLQTIILNRLRSKVDYTEAEWDFVDDKENNHRAIDIYARKFLHDHKTKQPIVTPNLSLLIECKKSELPYIFFLSSGEHMIRDFPLFAGLRKKEFTLSTNGSKSHWTMGIPTLFSLDSHPFLKNGPKYSRTFSDVVRESSKIRLSGNTSFKELILPIIKATNYFVKTKEPPSSYAYFECDLVLGIGVVDAPMIGVTVSENLVELELQPWIRIIRHENALHWTDERVLALDIVHKDFFNDYIDKHVIPFANEFARLVLKHQKVLQTGKGFAKEMEKYGFKDVERRLK